MKAKSDVFSDKTQCRSVVHWRFGRNAPPLSKGWKEKLSM
jgi:hypothetical protein